MKSMIKVKDIIFISTLLAVALAGLLLVFLFGENGAGVIVRVDGEKVGEYSLYEDGSYSLNGGTNILKIEDGCAYLTDAICPDHLCIKQGKVSKTGQTITCLPNKLTVTVYGAKEEAPELIS